MVTLTVPSMAFSIGTTPELGVALVDREEHLDHRVARQQLGVAEVGLSVQRLLGERAGRAEERHPAGVAASWRSRLGPSVKVTGARRPRRRWIFHVSGMAGLESPLMAPGHVGSDLGAFVCAERDRGESWIRPSAGWLVAAPTSIGCDHDERSARRDPLGARVPDPRRRQPHGQRPADPRDRVPRRPVSADDGVNLRAKARTRFDGEEFVQPT